MPTTPVFALRYPNETDTPDVPRDIHNLASDVETALGPGTAPPAGIQPNETAVWDGTAWARSTTQRLGITSLAGYPADGSRFLAGDGNWKAVPIASLAGYPSDGTKFVAGDGTWKAPPVTSIFGRTGDVVPTSGDYSVAQITGAAPLASPALTGTPTAPTAPTATNTTQIATTAFVKAQGYLSSAPVTSVFGRSGAVVAAAGDYSAAMVTNAADLSKVSGQVFAGPISVPGAFGATPNAGITVNNGLTMGSGLLKALNVQFGTGPTSQVSFFGQAFATQPSGGSTSPFNYGDQGSFVVHSAGLFRGNFGGTDYSIGDIVTALKLLGLIAA